ncbi:MAG: type II toxin-antitoxin system MqsR family toxin [Rugosibacter sp.]|nr:type II toxin-antitoxin system MqsR family toxin [Rugosibacter sp.]
MSDCGKKYPHCKLSVVKAMIEVGKVRSTVSALAGGAALGFDFAEIVKVVKMLTPSRFLQKHDHDRRPQDLAGRVPAHNASRRGLPETYGHR